MSDTLHAPASTFAVASIQRALSWTRTPMSLAAAAAIASLLLLMLRLQLPLNAAVAAAVPAVVAVAEVDAVDSWSTTTPASLRMPAVAAVRHG